MKSKPKSIIVDAYNYILALWDRDYVEEHNLWEKVRQNVFSLMQRFHTNTSIPITLVYDNKSNYTSLIHQSDLERSQGRVSILYSRPPREADDRIVSVVRKSLEPQSIVVVTNDEELIRRVRQYGAKYSKIADFRRWEEEEEDKIRQKFQRTRWLLDQLSNAGRSQRKEIVLELADMGYPEEAADAFKRLLEDEDAEIRLHSVRGLSKIALEDFRGYILSRLDDESAEVVSATAEILLEHPEAGNRNFVISKVRERGTNELKDKILGKLSTEGMHETAGEILNWYLDEENADIRERIRKLLASASLSTIIDLSENAVFFSRPQREKRFAQLLEDFIRWENIDEALQELDRLPGPLASKVKTLMESVDPKKRLAAVERFVNGQNVRESAIEFLINLNDKSMLDVLCDRVILLRKTESRRKAAMSFINSDVRINAPWILETLPLHREEHRKIIIDRLTERQWTGSELTKAFEILKSFDDDELSLTVKLLISFLIRKGSLSSKKIFEELLPRLKQEDKDLFFKLLEVNKDLVDLNYLLEYVDELPENFQGKLIATFAGQGGRKEKELLQKINDLKMPAMVETLKTIISKEQPDILPVLDQKWKQIPNGQKDQIAEKLVAADRKDYVIKGVDYIRRLKQEHFETLKRNITLLDAVKLLLDSFPPESDPKAKDYELLLKRYLPELKMEEASALEDYLNEPLPGEAKRLLSEILMQSGKAISVERKIEIVKDPNIGLHQKKKYREDLMYDPDAYYAVFGEFLTTRSSRFRNWILEGFPEALDVRQLAELISHFDEYSNDVKKAVENYIMDADDEVLLNALKFTTQMDNFPMDTWLLIWDEFLKYSDVTERKPIVEGAIIIADMAEKKGDFQTAYEYITELAYYDYDRKRLLRLLKKSEDTIYYEGNLTAFLDMLAYRAREEKPVALQDIIEGLEKLQHFRDPEFFICFLEMLDEKLRPGRKQATSQMPKSTEEFGVLTKQHLKILLQRLFKNFDWPYGNWTLADVKLMLRLAEEMGMEDTEEYKRVRLLQCHYLYKESKHGEAYRLLQQYEPEELDEYLYFYLDGHLRMEADMAKAVSLFIDYIKRQEKKSLTDDEVVKIFDLLIEPDFPGFFIIKLMKMIRYAQTGQWRDALILCENLQSLYPLGRMSQYLRFREVFSSDDYEDLLQKALDVLNQDDKNLSDRVLIEFNSYLDKIKKAAPPGMELPEFEIMQICLDAARMNYQELMEIPEETLEKEPVLKELKTLIQIERKELKSAFEAWKKMKDPELLERIIRTAAEDPENYDELLSPLLHEMEAHNLHHLEEYAVLCVYLAIESGSFRRYLDKLEFRFPADYKERFTKALKKALSFRIFNKLFPATFVRTLRAGLNYDELEAFLELGVEKLAAEDLPLSETDTVMLRRALRRVEKEYEKAVPLTEKVRKRLFTGIELDGFELENYLSGKKCLSGREVMEKIRKILESKGYTEFLLDSFKKAAADDPTCKNNFPELKKYLVKQHFVDKLQKGEVFKAFQEINYLETIDDKTASELLGIFSKRLGAGAADVQNIFLENWQDLTFDYELLRSFLLSSIKNEKTDSLLRLQAAAKWQLMQPREDAEVRAVMMRLLFESKRYRDAYYAWMSTKSLAPHIIAQNTAYSVVPLGIVSEYLEKGDISTAADILNSVEFMRYLQTDEGALISAFLNYEIAAGEGERNDVDNKTIEEARRKIYKLVENPDLQVIGRYLMHTLVAIPGLGETPQQGLKKWAKLEKKKREILRRRNLAAKYDKYHGRTAQAKRIQREIEKLIVRNGKGIEEAEKMARRELDRVNARQNIRHGIFKKIEKLRDYENKAEEVEREKKEVIEEYNLAVLNPGKLVKLVRELERERLIHRQREHLDVNYIYGHVIEFLKEVMDIAGGKN